MNNDSFYWYDPIIEDLPEHLAGSDSWTGHIPFAFYLMAVLRPARVVELGVFAGNSLFAFAQAAHKLGHPARISGVDTWESDPHSGGYDGAAVYQMVLEQQARYPDRVELHQASFDQARAAFAPESVDLLHIDGYHHYEAVSHDFLTWRETLTRAGVVLFHDIAVRRDDFGVWRFWGEIKREYGPEQTLEFTHSNGLGVLLLAPADRYPERMQSLLDAYRNAPETVRTLFRLAGQRVRDVFAARERQRQASEKIAGLEEASANWQREALHQQQEVARRQQDIANWREEALRQQQESANWREEAARRQQDVLHQQQEALNWRLECQNLTTRLETIYQSKSWRLTAPLRSVRFTLWFRSGPFMYRLVQRLKNALTYIRQGEWSELRRRLAFLRHGGMEAASETLDARHWTIVTPPHGNYVASLLAKRLRSLGMTVELLNAMPDSFGNGYYVVLAAQMFDRLPPGHQLYLYQLEQTQASKWFSKRYLHRLEHCRAVLEYKQSNMEYLAERGIVFPHVYALPIGGNPDLFQDDPGGNLTDDRRPVLFYGAWKANPRRTQLLGALSSDFELQREDNLFAPELYARIQVQTPRPVVLNLHHYDPAQLETPRLWEAVSLGALVVSEDSADRDEDPWLASAIDTVASGDLPGLRQTLQAAERGHLDNAIRRHLIDVSYARFCFYFDRFLVAEGFLQPDDRRVVSELPRAVSVSSRAVPRWCLTLPETPKRYANAQMLPVDRWVVGMRRRPGWMGCALSYRAMARQALAEGLEALWILEDDVALPQHFEERLAAVWGYLRTRDDWDICVGHMTLIESELVVERVVALSGLHLLYINQFLGMAANLYGRRALEAMAEWDPAGGDEYDNTIDQYLKRCGIRTVATWPYLVTHDEDYRSTLWGFNNAYYEETIRATREKFDDLCASARHGAESPV